MNADLTQPWNLADIVFIIDDKKLYVNKAILMMSSDVFNAMFTADFREKDLTEIPLPGKMFDSFLLLMKVIHPPTLEVNGTNVLQLLPLSHEYGVHHVTAACEKVLLTEPPSVQNLVLADKYMLEQLRAVCLEYGQLTPFTQLETQPGFDQLQPETMIEILRHKVLQTDLPQEPDEKEQKPEGTKTEEAEGAEAEPTKEFIYELMSKPPSVQNLLKGEKYKIPPVIQACVKYAQDRPLAKSKAIPGYDKISAATLIQILGHKVVNMEPKMKRLDTLEARVKQLNKLRSEIYTLDSKTAEISHFYSQNFSGPCVCPQSVQKEMQHTLGEHNVRELFDQHSICTECRLFALGKIYDVSRKALCGIRDSLRNAFD